MTDAPQTEPKKSIPKGTGNIWTDLGPVLAFVIVFNVLQNGPEGPALFGKDNAIFWATGVFMAAVAAILLTGRIGSTRPNIAMGWELDAITMVILGGVAIEGGRGSIVGTMLAVLLLGLFTFGMGMANVTGIVMSMVIGVLLIVSMVLPRMIKGKGVHA